LIFSHNISSLKLLYQYTLSYHGKKLKKEKTFSENMNTENAVSKSIRAFVFKTWFREKVIVRGLEGKW